MSVNAQIPSARQQLNIAQSLHAHSVFFSYNNSRFLVPPDTTTRPAPSNRCPRSSSSTAVDRRLSNTTSSWSVVSASGSASVVAARTRGRLVRSKVSADHLFFRGTCRYFLFVVIFSRFHLPSLFVLLLFCFLLFFFSNSNLSTLRLLYYFFRFSLFSRFLNVNFFLVQSRRSRTLSTKSSNSS